MSAVDEPTFCALLSICGSRAQRLWDWVILRGLRGCWSRSQLTIGGRLSKSQKGCQAVTAWPTSPGENQHRQSENVQKGPSWLVVSHLLSAAYSVCVHEDKGTCHPVQQWGAMAQRKKIYQASDTHNTIGSIHCWFGSALWMRLLTDFFTDFFLFVFFQLLTSIDQYWSHLFKTLHTVCITTTHLCSPQTTRLKINSFAQTLATILTQTANMSLITHRPNNRKHYT